MTKTPPSDSFSDIRNLISKHRESIDPLFTLDEIQYSTEEIIDEIEKLENILTNKSIESSWSFIHCDTGPQNVLNDPKTIIIDYEYGGFGFSYLDTIGYHLAFPQSTYQYRIPGRVIDRLDLIYFDTLKVYNNKISQSNFYDNIINAAAHWTINRLFYFWIKYFGNRLSRGEKYDLQFITDNKISEVRLLKMYQNMYTLFTSYLRASAKFDGSKIFEDLVNVVVNSIKKIRPKIEAFKEYPAFRKLLDD